MLRIRIGFLRKSNILPRQSLSHAVRVTAQRKALPSVAFAQGSLGRYKRQRVYRQSEAVQPIWLHRLLISFGCQSYLGVSSLRREPKAEAPSGMSHKMRTLTQQTKRHFPFQYMGGAVVQDIDINSSLQYGVQYRVILGGIVRRAQQVISRQNR